MGAKGPSRPIPALLLSLQPQESLQVTDATIWCWPACPTHTPAPTHSSMIPQSGCPGAGRDVPAIPGRAQESIDYSPGEGGPSSPHWERKGEHGVPGRRGHDSPPQGVGTGVPGSHLGLVQPLLDGHRQHGERLGSLLCPAPAHLNSTASTCSPMVVWHHKWTGWGW